MQIARKNENTIVLSHGEITVILAGLVFLAIGLSVAGLVNLEYHLTCQRAPNRPGQCQLAQTLLGYEIKAEPVNGLQGARLDGYYESAASRDEHSIIYQIVLLTAGREKPVGTSNKLNVAQKQRFVEDTNALVQYANIPRLNAAIGGVYWFSRLNVVFASIGIIMIIFGV